MARATVSTDELCRRPGDLAALARQAVPPTGFLRDYAQAFEDHTEAPYAFHLAGALSCLGAAIGRRAWTAWAGDPLHSNLYVALVGPQATGRKSTIMSYARSVLLRAFSSDLVYDGYATPEALVSKVLTQDAERLLLADELSSLISDRDYMAELKKVLTTLFDCPGSLSRSRMKSGTDTVMAPTVSILGGSNVTWLRGAIRSRDLGTGLPGRFLWFVGDWEGKLLPRPAAPDPARLQHLADRLAALRARLGNGKPFDPTTLGRDFDEIYRYYHERARQEDGEMLGGCLLRLASTHAPKLAMLYTLADDPAATEMKPDVLPYVRALLEFLSRGLYEVFERVAETEDDLLRERIHKLIAKRPGIDHRFALQLAHCKAVRFREAIETLSETGQVVVEKTQTGGKCYRALAALALVSSDGANSLSSAVAQPDE